MPELLLGPMLRHVTDRSATIWVETDGPCTVEILGRSTPTFSVQGHHFALVIIEGLEAGSVTEYRVSLDGAERWPVAGSTMPASVIRTLGDPSTLRVMFGSCRTAAPHGGVYAQELAFDDRGRGVDAMRAHALRMLGQPREAWPDIVLFLGDQVYADDTSPEVRERLAATRDEHDELPPDVVRNFEEYTWLYEEAWSPEVERWFLSVVPTTMIFDDHDMVDDWNISQSWVDDIRAERWWEDHVLGGLMTYWIYQHLGNLSPAEIREEGMLDALLAQPDGTAFLRDWARRSEQFTPVPGGYRFSFYRDLGRVRVVIIDARNGRVLQPGARMMVDDGEWEWIVDHCRATVDHLVIGTSLPVFVPGGLHDLQVWNEAVCDGSWGKRAASFGERLRRSLDLEDWPAFSRSFNRLTELLAELGTAERADAPATITIVSGDIHFSYSAEVTFQQPMASRVYQLVSSPIRNALTPQERHVLRFAISPVGRGIARLLRRAAKHRRSGPRWELTDGPLFANCLGLLTFEGRSAELTVEQATPTDDGDPVLDLAIRSRLAGG